MKTLYIDCAMGCAGDMLTAALLELHPDRDGFIDRMNTALKGKAVLSAKPDSKCGIMGTHVTVMKRTRLSVITLNTRALPRLWTL